MRQTFLWLADGVEAGSSLSELLTRSTRLPGSLVPLVRWGERTDKLPEALRDASEMYVVRIKLQAQLLQSVSPAVVFIFVFLMIAFAIIALFLPLVSLVQGLS